MRKWVKAGLLCFCVILAACGCSKMEDERATGGKEDGTKTGYFGALERYEDALDFSLGVDTSEKVLYPAFETKEEIQGYRSSMDLILQQEVEEETVLEILADILHHEMAYNKSNVAECVATVRWNEEEQSFTLRFTSKERNVIAVYRTQDFDTEQPTEIKNDWIKGDGIYLSMELSADTVTYQTPGDGQELTGVTKSYEITFFREVENSEILGAVQDYVKTVEKQEEEMGAQIPKPVERIFQVYQYDELIENIALRYDDEKKSKRVIYDAATGEYWEESEWGKE